MARKDTTKCTSKLTKRNVSHFYVKCETTITVWNCFHLNSYFLLILKRVWVHQKHFIIMKPCWWRIQYLMLLADRRICPSLRYVNNLYEKWLVEKKGASNASAMFDCLKEIVNYYNRNNTDKGGKCYLQRVDRNGSAKHDLRDGPFYFWGGGWAITKKKFLHSKSQEKKNHAQWAREKKNSSKPFYW